MSPTDRASTASGRRRPSTSGSSTTSASPAFGTRSRTGCASRPPCSRSGSSSGFAWPAGLAVEPEIILGDEPTSALDPQSSQNVERRLLELKRDYTVVVVTHILRQARRIADHLAFLYLGEIVEHGPAADVFANPKDPRTRAYLTGEIS